MVSQHLTVCANTNELISDERLQQSRGFLADDERCPERPRPNDAPKYCISQSGLVG